MTREEIIRLHEATCNRLREQMKAKNADYSGGDDDPFANFRASEILGVHPIIGILMRSLDKFMRIKSFVRTGTLAVKNEPVDDAFGDVINYMILGLGMVMEWREKLRQQQQQK